MPEKRPRESLPELLVHDPRHLSWSIYIPLAAGYVFLSAFELSTGNGFIPAFCFPQYCYPAYPSSMIVFSGYLLFSVRRWGLLAGPYTAFSALMFDGVESAGYTTYPFYLFWGLVLTAFAYGVRPRFRPSVLLVGYLFAKLVMLRVNAVIPFVPFHGVESLLEVVWCVALWRSVNANISEGKTSTT